MRAIMAVLGILAVPCAAWAQGPDTVVAPTAERFRIGLFGFGAGLGVDLDGDADVVLGYALDVADLYGDHLRLRPSAEIGLVGNGPDTYVGNLEAVYRFTNDREIAVPYVGVGLAVQGHQGCASDPQCPNLWAQFALGFELHLRPSFNWFLEYHGEDAFRHHRLFVGLVTRRTP